MARRGIKKGRNLSIPSLDFLLRDLGYYIQVSEVVSMLIFET